MYTDVQIESDLDSTEDLSVLTWEILGNPGAFCSLTWSSLAGEGLPIEPDVLIGTSSGGVRDQPCAYYAMYSWTGLNGRSKLKILSQSAEDLLSQQSSLLLFSYFILYYLFSRL